MDTRRQYVLHYHLPVTVKTMEGTLEDIYDTGSWVDIDFILQWKMTVKPGTNEKELTLVRKILCDIFYTDELWDARPREEGPFFFELIANSGKAEEVPVPVSQEELDEIVRVHCTGNPRMIPSRFTSGYWDSNEVDSEGWCKYVLLFSGRDDVPV